MNEESLAKEDFWSTTDVYTFPRRIPYMVRSSPNATIMFSPDTPGIEKTKELVLWEYWWPKMKKTVDAYIKGCKVCQCTKTSTQAKAAPLYPNTIRTEPWMHISVNMITRLPMLSGHDALLVIVDRFSKAIIPVTCNVKLSAEGWAWILWDHIYTRHGMPQVVISDWGPQFISKFMKELYRMLDITQNTSTAFHLQTDRQTEQVNQEIEKYLWIFINHRQDNWVNWLPLAEFTHNNWVHSTTGKSPFMVLYSQNPRVLPDSSWPSPLVNSAAFKFAKKKKKKKNMSQVHKETCDALEKAADNMKVQYDKKKCNMHDYHVGDKVWLDTTNLHLPQPKKKLVHSRSSIKLGLPPTSSSFPHTGRFTHASTRNY